MFTALALAKVLAFSQPAPLQFDGFNGVPKQRTAIERLADLPNSHRDNAGHLLCYMPGLIPIPIAAVAFINSIQPFTIAIGSAATSNTATVNSVSTTLSSLHIAGWSSDNGAASGQSDVGYLLQTNATTITGTRNTTAGNLTINGYIIEWSSDFMKSVQMGTISITTTGTSNTASVSSVTTSNSAVQWNGVSGSISGGSASVLTVVNLTSATVVTANRNTGSSATIITSYCLMEFQPGVLNSSTQEATPAQSSSGTSAEATISSVTTGQVWLVFGGVHSSNVGWNGGILPRLYLKDATTLREQTNIAVANSRGVGTAVEFKAAQITSVQRVTASTINDASNPYVDATITSVGDTTRCLVNVLGTEQTSGSSGVANLIFVRGALTSITNARFTRNTASATIQATPSAEIICFNF